MFRSETRLPHLLSPEAYFDPQQALREEPLLRKSWHPVALVEQLAQPGDFITCEVAGEAIQIRNFDGELRALSNVCAHRHCLISSCAHGNSSTMRCQYHGWEYGHDGKTRRIPEPTNFRPFESSGEQIPVFRVEACGPLVFVSPSSSGPDLKATLGELFSRLKDRPTEEWRPFLVQEMEHQANWKVVVENTLEAYHVPYIHAETFKETPSEQRSEHRFSAEGTSFHSTLPFAPESRTDAWFQRREGQFLRWLGRPVTSEYSQYHLFPNLLFSVTDAITLSHCVVPTGPDTCRSIVFQLGVCPTEARLKRLVCRGWGRMTGWVTQQIMAEDASLFPRIQKGLRSSSVEGVLGRCEERLHSFQSYIFAQTQSTSRVA
jgi:choline monooxygenase